MKNLTRLVIVLALIVFCGSVSYAQKFGVIAISELVVTMPEYDSALVKMEAYEKDVNDALESIGVEYRKKALEYQQNSSTYTTAMRDLKERELSDLNTRYQEYNQQAQTEGQRVESELMEPVMTKAQEAINKVAKANNMVFVFEKNSGIQYFDAATVTDIMALVKKELGITK